MTCGRKPDKAIGGCGTTRFSAWQRTGLLPMKSVQISAPHPRCSQTQPHPKQRTKPIRMAEHGHIKVSRKFFESDPFWNDAREFSRSEAWLDLIQRAAWKDHSRLVGGQVVEIKRGEFLGSLRFLAEAWGWGVKKVRLFLPLLVKMGRIRAQHETPQGTVYLLENYDSYQSADTEKGTQKGTGRAQEGHKEKAGKEKNTFIPPENGGEKPKRNVKTKRPTEWEPNLTHHRIANESGVDLRTELAAWTDWCRANGARYVDWDAAFATWLRNAKRFNRSNGSRANGTNGVQYPRPEPIRLDHD